MRRGTRKITIILFNCEVVHREGATVIAKIAISPGDIRSRWRPPGGVLNYSSWSRTTRARAWSAGTRSAMSKTMGGRLRDLSHKGVDKTTEIQHQWWQPCWRRVPARCTMQRNISSEC